MTVIDQIPALLPFYAFVLAPLVALLAAFVGSVLIIYRLGERRLLIVVAILLMMSQHQLLEAFEFLRSNQLGEPFLPELVETAANLLTAGSVYYVLAVLQEERRLAEELERSKERYSGLVENAPAPILVQAGGEIRYANPAAIGLFQAGGEADLVGHPVTEFVHPDDRDSVGRHVEEVLAEDEPVIGLTKRFHDFEGGTHHAAVIMNPITHEGDDAVQIVLHDTTERREYERELRRTNERLETIFQSSNDALVIIDPAAEELIECNRSACELLGYPRHELLELSPFDIHPHEAEQFETFVDDVLREGSRRTEEFSCLRKDDRKVPVEVSASTVEFRDRTCVLAAIRDISERKKRERWGEVLNRVLRHNLRTEINLIVGYADELVDEVRSDEPAEKAAAIREKGMDLISMGDDIRRLQRTISREGAAAGESDLVPLVESVVKDVRADYPGAEITTDLPDPPVLPANELLRQALANLIENAVEHNDKPVPEVEITVTRGGDSERSVSVRIADNGPGIPEQDREVVAGDGEITPIHHGSGLGLWIAAWTVEALGGSMLIDDNDPEGSIVTLRLEDPDTRPESDPESLQIVDE